MVRIGLSVAGSPTGDIFVSAALIAQRGAPFVRRMVRAVFNAAHDAARRDREYRARDAQVIGSAVQPDGEGCIVSTARQWVRFNPLTNSYDTPDGTRIAAELVDSVKGLADILYIAGIRANQRAVIRAANTGRSVRHG